MALLSKNHCFLISGILEIVTSILRTNEQIKPACVYLFWCISCGDYHYCHEILAFWHLWQFYEIFVPVVCSRTSAAWWVLGTSKITIPMLKFDFSPD